MAGNARIPVCAVSTHSRLKAAGPNLSQAQRDTLVSTHSRLKAAGRIRRHLLPTVRVSTHSRLKAAGYTHKKTAD